jgi:site-specific recombinase XerD
METHIDLDKPIDYLCKTDFAKMIAATRDAGLTSNTIRIYTRTISTFLAWCREEGITNLHILSIWPKRG